MRKTFASSLIIASLVLTGATPTSAEPILGNPAQRGLAEWAIGRFEGAGLELPPVTIAFHDEKGPCDGHLGLYRHGGLVDLCKLTVDSTAARKTALHELGHAWADHNLDESQRDTFLIHRGLEEWSSHTVPWSERGFEQAAEMLAWALMDVELQIVTIPNAEASALAAGYQLLTGKQPGNRGVLME
jgi:hypothetical protein